MKVFFSQLTAKQAKTWLVENDPEGADLWEELQSKKDLIECVADNLKDFGLGGELESGTYFITSNHDAFVNSDYYNGRFA